MNNNYGLVYPSLKDYYDVNVTNSNFSKLADGIDAVKSGGLKKEIVVATYDTVNSYKDVADYVCTKTNASEILQKAIDSCKSGGVIMLLDGSYTINATVNINKEITIMGFGNKTNIIQADVFTGYTMFNASANNITIKDLTFNDSTNAITSVYFVTVNNISIKIGGCDFILNRNNTQNQYAAIYCPGYKCRVLVMGCYMRKHNDSGSFIYSGDCITTGVVMGNYCEDIDDDNELPITIWAKNNDSAAKIKNGAQKTVINLKTGGVYNG